MQTEGKAKNKVCRGSSISCPGLRVDQEDSEDLPYSGTHDCDLLWPKDTRQDQQKSHRAKTDKIRYKLPRGLSWWSHTQGTKTMTYDNTFVISSREAY
jgi:hypothetical protein